MLARAATRAKASVSSMAKPPYFTIVRGVRPANLIQYPPLWETSGAIAYDQSGLGNNAAYLNTPALGQAGIGDGRACPYFAGSTAHVNLYSAALASAFNAAEGTFALWVKPYSAAFWTDGTLYFMFNLGANANYDIRIIKSGNNTLAYRYKANLTSSSISLGSLTSANWMHLALTWSVSANQVIAYYNGQPTGTPQAIGTWSGSLASTLCCVGSQTTTGGLPLKGWATHPVIYTAALSAAEVAKLTQRFFLDDNPDLLPSGYYSAMAYGSTLYAAKTGNLAAKSMDGGMTWTDFSFSFPNALQCVFPTKDGILLASSSGRIYRSADDGANWTEVFQTSATPNSNINTWGWAQSPSGTLYAGEYGTGVKCLYLWKSTNDGVDWTRIDYFADLSTKHLHQVMVDPETSRLYVNIGDVPKETYYSDDEGANWTQIFGVQSTGFTGATTVPGARFFGDDLDPGNNRIWKTTDDNALAAVYTPPTAIDNQPVEVVSRSGTPKLYGTFFNQTQDAGLVSAIVHSTDGGATWYPVITAPVGGYQFSRIVHDWRHRIPADLGYLICNCVTDTQMMRIPI